jgi:acetyl-CoA C-acetyltransferase
MGSVWIAGSYQSDFARNCAREGLEISDMVAEAVAGTLEAAGVAAADVEAIHVGNAFGQLFTGKGQLGAMPATVEPRLRGKPAARHEAACASGSVAVGGCPAPTAPRSPTAPRVCWCPTGSAPTG